jgi:hypothetical protein
MNVRNPIAKIKKSCGQNIMPKKINLRSRILKRKSGESFTLIKGSVKKTTRYIILNQVLRLYSFPLGFFGLIKFLFPSLVIVDTESLKDSS